MYFVGWATASLFLPRLADIYGRKKFFLISMTAFCCLYIAIVASKNIDLTIVLFGFLGICSVGRETICYLFLMELTPKKYQTMFGSITCAWGSLLMVWESLYFMFISKQWLGY